LPNERLRRRRHDVPKIVVKAHPALDAVLLNPLAGRAALPQKGFQFCRRRRPVLDDVGPSSGAK
jgi:hypothetical protein